MIKNKFWTIWRENSDLAPSRRHASKSLAIKEASSLARQLNEPYFVLEVIGLVYPAETPVHYEEINESTNHAMRYSDAIGKVYK